MDDETEALSTLRDLGRKALDEAGVRKPTSSSYDAHEAFRNALAEYSDDVLWRLFERASKVS